MDDSGEYGKVVTEYNCSPRLPKFLTVYEKTEDLEKKILKTDSTGK